MAPQIESIAAGYNWFNLEQLRLAVPVFQALYQDHMALEESLAYPEAKAQKCNITSLDTFDASHYLPWELANKRKWPEPIVTKLKPD